MDYERVLDREYSLSTNTPSAKNAVNIFNVLHIEEETDIESVESLDNNNGDHLSSSNTPKKLLPKQDSPSHGQDVNNKTVKGNEIHGKSEDEDFLDENSPLSAKLGNLLGSAWPLISSFFLSITGNFILMIFAGHAKESNGLSVATVFAGVSLSNLFCNVTFRSLIIGMTGAMDTLGSQNNGAGRYAEVGRTLQRSILVLACTSLLSIGMWLNAERFFLLLGMNPQVCLVSGTYVRIRMFEMPISCFYESYEKYLMSIGVMRSPMYANIALNISVVLFCSIGIFVMHWDYRCLAVSWVLSVLVACVTMVATSYKHPHVQRTLLLSWDWPVLLKANKLKEFVSLGVPGTLMLCSEWWAYEILTVFAGRLGVNEVAAETIIMQLAALAFMLPLGLSVATASIVGNALGRNKRDYAIQMAHYAIATIFVLEILVGAVLRGGGRVFCKTFTDDAGVLETTYELIFFLSIFCIFDGMQGVGSGVLRGAGQQSVGAITNIASFYLVGLPCAWLVCFNLKMRVPGLMVGISAGTALQAFSLCFLVFRRTDYVFRSQLQSDDDDGSMTSDTSVSVLASHNHGAASIELVSNDDYCRVSDMDSSSYPLAEYHTAADLESNDVTGMVDIPLTLDDSGSSYDQGVKKISLSESPATDRESFASSSYTADADNTMTDDIDCLRV